MLTPREFAAARGVKWGTVKRWCHEGMPVQKVAGGRYGWVRIDPTVADPWVAAHSRGCTFGRTALVYFAQAEPSGPIKIGFTSNVARRLHELGKGRRHLKFVALLELAGDKRLEGELHARFAAHRISREWFRPASELLEFIAERRAA